MYVKEHFSKTLFIAAEKYHMHKSKTFPRNYTVDVAIIFLGFDKLLQHKK